MPLNYAGDTRLSLDNRPSIQYSDFNPKPGIGIQRSSGCRKEEAPPFVGGLGAEMVF
jgi:hypothetical protein